MPVARAVVELGLVSQGLNKGLIAAQAQLRSFAQRIGGIGRTMTIGISAPLVAGGVALFKLGAEAVESEDLFSVSMGRMADSARTWSEELSEKLGSNSFEIRKNVAQLNVMLSSMGITEDKAFDMSKAVTELAGDLSSFYDLPTEEAFRKLRSGLTGSTEPLMEIGINVQEAAVNMALLRHEVVTSTKNLTVQQKVMGRYLAIMDATAKAQGNLALTAGSPTNMLRRLGNQLIEAATTMSMSLMPAFRMIIQAMERATNWAVDMADQFSKLSAMNKLTALAIAATAAAIGPLLIVTGLLAGSLAAILGLLTLIISPIGLVITGIAALTAVFVSSLGAGETFFAQLKSGFGSLVGLLDIAVSSWKGFNSVIGQLGTQLVGFLYEKWLWLKDQMIQLWDSVSIAFKVKFQEMMAFASEIGEGLTATMEKAMGEVSDIIGTAFIRLQAKIENVSDEELAYRLKNAAEFTAGEMAKDKVAHEARLADIQTEHADRLASLLAESRENNAAAEERKKDMDGFAAARKQQLNDFLVAMGDMPKLSDKFKPLLDSLQNAFDASAVGDQLTAAGSELKKNTKQAAQGFKTEFVGLEDLWKRISKGSKDVTLKGPEGDGEGRSAKDTAGNTKKTVDKLDEVKSAIMAIKGLTFS